MAQCNYTWDQEAGIMREINGHDLNDGYPAENSVDYLPKPFSGDMNLPWDLSADQIRISNSQFNFFTGGLLAPSGNAPTDSIISDKPTSFNSPLDHGFSEISDLQRSLINSATANLHPSIAESSMCKELEHDKESIKKEMGRGDSVSDCSDQIDDDDDQKAVGRTGRRHQSKNLVAERNRRKKLNGRLYALRALVPKISKMDRASILGDAIDYVKELQKQAKDLEDELEETPDEEEARRNCNDNNKDNDELDTPHQNVDGHLVGESPDGGGNSNADHGTRGSSVTKSKNHESLSADDNAPQMEPQVEVSQVDGNEFFLKVFCEHKPGGFVKLLEAINSLGFEVTNANVTNFRRLVLNIFRIEKRDRVVVQADQVRDSLLELTRSPNGDWPESGCVAANGGGDYLHHHHHHHLYHLHHQP